MLELHPRQAFNASMEHSNEKQHSNNPSAYEACIQDTYLASQAITDIWDKINQFKDRAINPRSEAGMMLGRITKGMLVVSRDAIDEDDAPEAGRMFLSGAMAGLYIGDKITGGNVPMKQVLDSSYELLEDGPRKFMYEAATTFDQMDALTANIVNRLKQVVGGGGAGDAFFEIGFGITMRSVDKTICEIDTLDNLEKSVDWELPDLETSLAFTKLSVDRECKGLAEAFRDHMVVCGAENLSGQQLYEATKQAGRFLERDLLSLEELRIEDRLQTRGVGLFITFDEKEMPDDLCEYGPDTIVSGRLVRTECMLVPSEFSVMIGEAEEEASHEPQACLILDTVEMVDGSGDTTPYDGVVAIPLRLLGTQLDKVIPPGNT